MPVPKVSHFQQQTPRVSARRSPPKVEPRTGPDLAQEEKQHSDKAAEVASQAIMAPGGNGDGQDSPLSALHNQFGLTPQRKFHACASQASTSSVIGDLKISSSPSPLTHNIPALQIPGIAYSAAHRVFCQCCGGPG